MKKKSLKGIRYITRHFILRLNMRVFYAYLHIKLNHIAVQIELYGSLCLESEWKKNAHSLFKFILQMTHRPTTMNSLRRVRDTTKHKKSQKETQTTSHPIIYSN